VRFVEQSFLDITVDRTPLTRRARAKVPALGRCDRLSERLENGSGKKWGVLCELSPIGQSLLKADNYATHRLIVIWFSMRNSLNTEFRACVVP
jgi:hypothetical protein